MKTEETNTQSNLACLFIVHLNPLIPDIGGWPNRMKDRLVIGDLLNVKKNGINALSFV